MKPKPLAEIALALYRDNGKENGSYCIIIGYIHIRDILGFCRDNGKENGNYYIIMGYILGRNCINS